MKFHRLLLSLLLLAAINLANANKEITPPSCATIKMMRAAINKLFVPFTDENGSTDLLHDFVRFAFHSCVGGCDGCINMIQGANSGLDDALAALEEAYSSLGLADLGVSRADFWALAGMVAIEKGAQKNNKIKMKIPCFHYQWGRKDCPTSPLTDIAHEFPSGSLTREQMFSFFQRRFNFDEREVTAILGAHNLGEAHLEHSGFEGSWKPKEEDQFNNDYYAIMLDPIIQWSNADASAGIEGASPHWQWNGYHPIENVTYMMLNTDFEIFFDLQLDANAKTVCELDTQCIYKGTCGKNGVCGLSGSHQIALDYIDKPNDFMTDFVKAFTKMVHNGVHHHLPSKGGLCSMCSEPTTPPSCDLVSTMKKSLLKLFGPLGGDEQQDSLRFSFHTCVGGCHGCINLNQGENKGLESITAKLEKLYADLGLSEAGVSRADFWALAGTVSIEVGVAQHRGSPIHKPCFDYYWGRTDCPTAPFTKASFEFPAGWMTSEQMFSFFKRRMKLTKEETVALLGAHTIGEAKKSNSGYDGIWIPEEESTFNTTYYEAMIDPTLKWTNENAGFRNGHEHWQWKAKDPETGEEYFMLNTDFELFFDLVLDGDGKTQCILDNTCVQKGTCGENGICAQSATYDQAAGYAMSNNAFYKDFKPTYTKMLFNGNHDLTVVGGTCGKCQ